MANINVSHCKSNIKNKNRLQTDNRQISEKDFKLIKDRSIWALHTAQKI